MEAWTWVIQLLRGERTGDCIGLLLYWLGARNYDLAAVSPISHFASDRRVLLLTEMRH